MHRNVSLAVAPTSHPFGCIELVEYAFQPIVGMGSLRTHGFEALARMSQASEYRTINELLDELAIREELLIAEYALLTKALTKFATFNGASASRLFCNIDNRVFDDTRISPGKFIAIAADLGLAPANICIELSERRPPSSIEAFGRIVDVFLSHNIRIAIDDFGQGFSGLDTLMRVHPHYVKIDQAFIHGVADSTRKQAIVSKVAGLSHSLGLIVVAEGVETEADFRMARDLGCDLAQGYFIARPTTNVAELKLSYEGATRSDTSERLLPQQIDDLMTKTVPVHMNDGLELAVQRFKSGSSKGFLPVVDDHDYVHGAIFEEDLRYFLFGDFGAALLANKGIEHKVSDYMQRCPISDIGSTPQSIVDSYVVAGGNLGIILTLDGRYHGVLSNQALLRLAAEREVAAARDQNPLTFLPGNNSISRHLTDILSAGGDRTVTFFDFDNFKAFNDAYGFAVGDRALLMFSDLLMKLRHSCDAFVGHIGGDDFFLSIAADAAHAEGIVRRLSTKFNTDVESLYLIEDRLKGGLWAKDRFGQTRFLPLLRVSAVLLLLPASRSHLSAAQIVGALANGKTSAKQSIDGIVHTSLPATAVAQELERLVLITGQATGG